jgi:hypothetical protein
MKEFVVRQSSAGLEIVDPITGATTDTLTTGELFEQLMSLFELRPRAPYPMKKPEEWGESYFCRRQQ